MRTIKEIKNFFRVSEEKKMREKSRREQQIKQRFSIEEIHGKIAITLYDTPIRVFGDNTTTKQIEEEIKAFRKTAVEYIQLESNEPRTQRY